MGTAPTDTNPAAQSFDNILSEIALQKLLPMAEAAANTAAEAQVPFLAFPVVKQIFEGLDDEAMSALAGVLLNVMVQAGIKVILTIQTDVEKATYSAAEGALRAALLTGDPVKIATAKQEMDNAANSVIFYDGSVSAPTTP